MSDTHIYVKSYWIFDHSQKNAKMKWQKKGENTPKIAVFLPICIEIEGGLIFSLSH